MRIAIPKDIGYQLLFVICIGVTYVNNYELTFTVWSLTALITIRRFYSLTIAKHLVIFLAIMAIAVVVYFFKDYPIYFVIRDITYMVKPILGLLIGYQLCKINFKAGLRLLVYTGLLIAVIHLYLLLSAVVFHQAYTVNDLRLYGGYFSDFEVYVLIVLFFSQKFELGFSKKEILFFSVIVGTSALFYLARTNFLQFIILFLAVKGYFKWNRTSILVLTLVVSASVIGYSTILYINPQRSGKGIEALLYKIKIAPTEPFRTKITRDDWKDFNDNYRSYENIRTFKQLTFKGYGTMLFGEGIGSRVDLKQKVWLGDMELRYISILHNGFMTVFLKSGLFGLFLYFYSIYILFPKAKSQIPIVRHIDLLFLGTALFLVLSNLVFMGVYNLLDNKSILIGFLICYREILIKNSKNPIENA